MIYLDTGRRHGSVKGSVISKAKARLRWQQVRDASISGMSREEAAELVGMKLTGLKNMLIREVGSSAWPIRIEQ